MPLTAVRTALLLLVTASGGVPATAQQSAPAAGFEHSLPRLVELGVRVTAALQTGDDADAAARRSA